MVPGAGTRDQLGQTGSHHFSQLGQYQVATTRGCDLSLVLSAPLARSGQDSGVNAHPPRLCTVGEGTSQRTLSFPYWKKKG